MISRIASLRPSHRLIQVSRKCPPTDTSCLFSSPPPPHFLSFPKQLDLIWPVIWILPGLVSPTTSLPWRIGPITPQPQSDHSSLSLRERRSKRRFDEHPPSLLSSPLPRRRTAAQMKDLNSRPTAPRSPLGSPLNSPSLLLSSN